MASRGTKSRGGEFLHRTVVDLPRIAGRSRFKSVPEPQPTALRDTHISCINTVRSR